MRPPKTNEDKLSGQVSFRLTPPEKARLGVLADQARLRPNELARLFTKRAMEGIAITFHRNTDPAVIKRLNDLGLIFRQMRKDVQAGQPFPAKLDELCDEISAIVKTAVLERVKE